ncbi:hypothetical protein SH1V18_15860 [Vallitalea longa]|uniref:Uncharacterized protein n=1 Tax=Vallitalea longa TaxID=2936439 RepID=A0A9W5YAH1_9FIRM|nr:hypothetical protein [Vallitalea longa]GKX29106.1 hypothetical protein SH1V18_15860 [Vallitalea longa]
MKSLIKYELKRDRVFIWALLVMTIIFSIIYISIYDLTNKNTTISITIILLCISFIILLKRLNHIVNDTLRNREHMGLIPKSVFQIVMANCIVVYMDCIIFGIIIAYIYVNSYNFNPPLLILVITNLIFTFYILTTLIYIILNKYIKIQILSALICILSLILIIKLITINNGLLLGFYFINIYLIESYQITMLIIISLICIITLCKILGYKYRNRAKNLKIIILIIITIVLINFTTQYYVYSHRNIDDTQVPFVEDTNLVGTWKTVDFVKDYNNYIPKNNDNEFIFECLTFKQNGSIDEKPLSSWTNGFVMNFPLDQTKAAYVIEEINNEKYLYIQWKSGDYVYRHTKPSYYVLKKISK